MEKHAYPLVTLKLLGKTAAYTALASAVFMATQAQAQLLNNLTMGNPKALALGNAVTADPPGIDSIHFNPAGLAKIKGRQRQIKLLVAHMELESKFGYPTRPDEDALRSNWLLDTDCQANPGAYPDNRDGYQACYGYDPVGNTTTSSGDPVLMLPFVGLTDIPILAVPTGGIAFEDAANGWTFGTAVYTPEGVGFTRDEDESGAYQGIRVGVTRLTYFSPTVAIQVTDELSIGAGITFSYQGLGIQTKFRAPLITTSFLANATAILGPDFADLYILEPYDTVGLLEMEMDDYMSVGFNFGILWEPTEWIAFGFSYRSESTSDLSGDFKMTNTDEFLATTEGLSGPPLALDNLLFLAGGAPFNVQKVESGTVELEYISPQSLSFGTSIRVLPSLKVNVDLRWIEYSVWDTLDFKFDRNVDFLTLASVVNFVSPGVGDDADPDEMRIPRHYEDSWSAALGVEYTMNDNLVLRFGYEPRASSIPDDRTDLLFPITDAQLFSCGFGWQYDKSTRIEGSFGYLYSDSNTPSGKSRNANSDIEGDVVYNPYFATDFENTTTAYLFALSVDQKF